MLDRRVTFIPVEFRDALSEFEKLLCNPRYAQWQLVRVLQKVESEELTRKETAWLTFLKTITNDEDAAARYVFAYLKKESEQFASDQKELITFFIRLMQKRPEYANQMLDLMK